MLQNVYGIKSFQTHLPSIAKEIEEFGGHHLVTRRSQPAFVAIPFADYQAIEDIILELNTPSLQNDIAQGRKEYQEGKTESIEEVMKDLA